MDSGQPNYGRRLVPHVVDERARNGHRLPFASIPRTTKAEDGFEDITYARFSNAVNRCSHWLNTIVADQRADGIEAIAYIGPQDLRYHIIALAAAKTGLVIFFPSPRNSLQAFDSLFDETRAIHLISNPDPLPIVKTLAQRLSIQHSEIASLQDLLDPTPVPHITLDRKFEELRFQPWVYLHTSGSTGIPKIIPIKYGHVATVDSLNLLEHNEAFERWGNMRTLVPFPSFHIAGFNFGLPAMIWMDSTLVLPLPGIPTAGMCHAVHEHGNVEYSVLAPSLIADLAKNEEYLAGLGRLNGIAYSGGPISLETAMKVSRLTKLTSTFGATEYGAAPLYPREKAIEDVNYISFNEELGGLEFRELEGQPGLYELVIVRDRRYDKFQTIFVTFPDLDEYHTKDGFSPHPTKPGLWQYEARLDDVIVLSNGEKLNPVTMEGIISSCPEVRSCLVVGQGRFQTALIVEPAKTDADRGALLASIKPYVRRANEHCPRYGRISDDFVIVTSSEKPFPRAGKGTVQRAPSAAAYGEEIEELYSMMEKSQQRTVTSSTLDLSTEERTTTSLLAHVRDDFGLEDGDLHPEDDIFAFGMDSLQVMGLVRIVNKSLKPGKPTINAAFIYEHPTVQALAEALSSGAAPREYSDFGEDDEFTKKTLTSMEQTFQRFRAGSQRDGAASGDGPWFWRLTSALKSHRQPPLYQADGGWSAWMQVLGSFLVNTNNWGLINSFGAYQAFYENNLLSDYSPSNIAWIGTVQGTLLLVIGVVSGPLFDRGYFRCTLILAGLGVVFGLMMLSLARNFYSIMLAQGILIGLCLGLLYIPSVALIPLYFKRKRGLALGLATAGGSFGGIIYPIMFRRLLDEVGFGWANRIMGFVALATLGIATVLLRPIGARLPRELLDTSAFREPAYVCFAIAGFIIFSGVLAPFFLIPTFGTEVVSAPQNLSFYLLSVANAAQFFGRILPAILADWIGPEAILLFAEVVAGIVALCWIAVKSLSGFIAWVVVYGFFSGIIVTLPAAVVPFLCPSMAVLGTRLGMVYAVGGLGFLISVPLALSLTNPSGGIGIFLGAQIWIGVCCLAGATFFAVAAVEVWQRRRLYERNVMHSSNYLFRSPKGKELDDEKV